MGIKFGGKKGDDVKCHLCGWMGRENKLIGGKCPRCGWYVSYIR